MKLMFERKSFYVVPVLALSIGAGSAIANPNLTEAPPTSPVFIGLEFAQTSVDDLGESDLRRINFYTGRALESLAVLADQDALATNAGAAVSSNSVDDLRNAIKRLIDAGKRSGINQDDLADYFALAVEERFNDAVPLAVQDASGEIDTRTLFAGIVGRIKFAEERQVDVDYLALLDAESADLDLGLSNEPAEAQVAEVEITPTGPVLRDDADAATRAIIGRVVVDGDVWRIQVVTGDSLATFASAIYGDSLAYRQIFAANQNILTNPNTISVGQVLTIPKP
ncbi:MAG: LysM peptidoglycan-binding domain-containing protein [Rhodobacteraceae bacterium]|nr:LysM peptidoglycan-binding domain-containing protein [Paracoccaceae bacterium]